MTPWTAALQAPLSMRFPRREYRRGLPFPSPGDLPDPGIEPTSPALAGGSLSLSHQGSPMPPLTATLHPHPFICHPSFPFWVKKGAESSKKTHQDHETNIKSKILPQAPRKEHRGGRLSPLSCVLFPPQPRMLMLHCPAGRWSPWCFPACGHLPLKRGL